MFDLEELDNAAEAVAMDLAAAEAGQQDCPADWLDLDMLDAAIEIDAEQRALRTAVRRA